MGERRTLGLARRDLIGLDVDLCSVKMIQLRRKNGQYVVVGAATSSVAPWGNDHDAQQAHTVDAVRECLDALGSGSRLAVCGLQGPEVVVRGFEFPTLPPEEIDGAVELEASQVCPFSTEDVTLDHQIVSDCDKRIQGFWVAATRRLIESRRQVAREAGLQCVLMDVDGLALLNCLENSPGGAQQQTGHPETDRLDGTRPAILHMGDSYATIAIVDHASRPFVRDVSSASHQIIRQVAHDLRMSDKAVLAAFFGDEPADPGLLQRSLEKACEHLMDDVVTTLRYYAAQNRLERVSGLLVCGRFALARGFIELLSARLPFHVALWNPVVRMPCEGNSQCEMVLQQVGPSMAIASGMAMRTI